MLAILHVRQEHYFAIAEAKEIRIESAERARDCSIRYVVCTMLSKYDFIVGSNEILSLEAKPNRCVNQTTNGVRHLVLDRILEIIRICLMNVRI